MYVLNINTYIWTSIQARRTLGGAPIPQVRKIISGALDITP